MQNRWAPSFFLTITTGELHALRDGSITPSRNMTSTSWSIMACMACANGLRGLYRCLIGCASVKRRRCCMRFVGPVIGTNSATRKFWSRSSSSEVRGVIPPDIVAVVLPGLNRWRGGGGKEKRPSSAHTSMPINMSFLSAGIISNIP
jgi:hypothetical protein